MELRFADDEKKENLENSLKLSETSHQQVEKEDSEIRQNPWDFDIESEPVVISSIDSTIGIDTVETKKQETGELILKIGMILVYGCFILEIVSIAWICSQEVSNLYANILKVQGIFHLCGILCIADAIAVNAWYERKLSLIFWAWFFCPLYPVQRNKCVNGRSGMATWCCVGVLIACLVLFANIFKGFFMYGKVIMIEEEGTRTEVVALMDQTMENGQRIGDKIMKSISVEGATMQKQGTYTIIGLLGEGSVKIDGDVFMDTGIASVDTRLGFVKEGNGNYELQAVVLDGTKMTPNGAKSYWDSVICR